VLLCFELRQESLGFRSISIESFAVTATRQPLPMQNAANVAEYAPRRAGWSSKVIQAVDSK